MTEGLLGLSLFKRLNRISNLFVNIKYVVVKISEIFQYTVFNTILIISNNRNSITSVPTELLIKQFTPQNYSFENTYLKQNVTK